MSTNIGDLRIKLTGDSSDFEAKFNAVKAQLEAAGVKIDGLGSKFRQFASHGPSDVQATSAALRLMEGGLTNNLRAAERFLATTAGIGPILKTAFPVVGGLAFIGVLGQMFDHVSKLKAEFDKIREAPLKIAEDGRGIIEPLRLANDELRVSNDRLEDEIAKIQGKPQNGIKEALDETREASDRLSESLHRNFAELQKVFQESNIGSMKGFFTNVAATTDIKKMFGGDTGYGGYRAQIDQIRATYDEALAAINPNSKGADKQAGALGEAEYVATLQKLRDILGDVNDKLKTRLALQKQAQQMVPNIEPTPYGPTPGTPTVLVPKGGPDQAPSIEELKTAQSDLKALIANATLERIHGADQGALSGLKAGQSKPDNNASDPYGDGLRELQNELAKVRSSLAAFTNPFSEALVKGYEDAARQIRERNAELTKQGKPPLTSDQGQEYMETGRLIGIAEYNKLLDEQAKTLDEAKEHLAEEMAAGKAATEAKTRAIQEQIAATQKLMATQWAQLAGGPAPSDRAQTAVKVDEISAKTDWTDPTASANAKAQIDLLNVGQREKEIQEALKLTKDEQLEQIQKQLTLLDNVKADGGDNLAIDAEILNLKKQQLDIIDKQVLATGTALDGVKVFFREMADEATSSAQKIHDVFKEAFDGFNTEIAKAITGKKANFAGVFENLAQTTAKGGLTSLEQRAAKGLGLGKPSDSKRPMGTPTDPIYVSLGSKDATNVLNQMNPLPSAPPFATNIGSTGDSVLDALGMNLLPGASAYSGAGDSDNSGADGVFGGLFSQVGGFFKSIFGKLGGGGGGFSSLFGPLFGGFLADGGGADAGKAYIVGEEGPELWTPPSSGGTVHPNGALGGGGTAYYNIDARGANAADVEMRTQRALIAVHGSAVRSSVALQREARTRLPRNKFLVS